MLLHPSQSSQPRSWAPQTQPTWGSLRAWPRSPCPSAWTPSPTCCTVPSSGLTASSSLCLPAHARPRTAAPNPAWPRGHPGAAVGGKHGAGQAEARARARGQVRARVSSDGAQGGLSSPREAGRGGLGLVPRPDRQHRHCPPRMGRKHEAWSPLLRRPQLLKTGKLNTRPREAWYPAPAPRQLMRGFP